MLRKRDLNYEHIIFNSLKSFEDYISYYTSYCLDEVKYHPLWKCAKKNLYEENDNIVYYLTEYNKRGYITRLSQPSVNDNGWIQYPYVVGIIKLDIAINIFNFIKDDPRLVMVISNNYNKKYVDNKDFSHLIKSNDNICVTYNKLKPYSWFSLYTSLETTKFIIDKLMPSLEHKEEYCEMSILDLKCDSDKYIFEKLLSGLIKFSHT